MKLIPILTGFGINACLVVNAGEFRVGDIELVIKLIEFSRTSISVLTLSSTCIGVVAAYWYCEFVMNFTFF